MGASKEAQERQKKLFESGPVHVDILEKRRIETPKGYYLCQECFEYFSKHTVCIYCKGEEKRPVHKLTLYHKKLDANYKSKKQLKEKIDKKSNIEYKIEKCGYKYIVPEYIPLRIKIQFKRKFEKTFEYVPDDCVKSIMNFIENKFNKRFEEFKIIKDKKEINNYIKYTIVMIRRISKYFMLEKNVRKKIRIENRKYLESKKMLKKSFYLTEEENDKLFEMVEISKRKDKSLKESDLIRKIVLDKINE